MKISNYYLATCILIASCSIRGNFKGLYAYQQKTVAEIPEKFLPSTDDDDLCSYLVNDDRIIITNGKKLKKCVTSENALFYIWGPNCTSKICYPLSSIEYLAFQNNLQLYIIAEYYDSEKMSYDYGVTSPIIGIDTKYYQTSKTANYLEKFLTDMGIKRSDFNHRYYVGKANGNYESVQDIYKYLK
jgi:hypothetical protein